MTIINVELEENLSADQVAQIMDLLRLIRGVARVTSDEPFQTVTLSSPEPRGTLVPSGRPKQEIDLDNINPGQKKHIISQAIAWGSRNGKITLNVLERLSPEEMVSLATNFLSEMSDDEKDDIFRGMA